MRGSSSGRLFLCLCTLTILSNHYSNAFSSASPAGSTTSVGSGSSNTPQKPKQTSLGEAIQSARTEEELLEIAGHFWLPNDPDLPRHLQDQRVHHEKRQRWSAQWFEKLNQNLGMPTTTGGSPANTIDHPNFLRALRASALPFTTVTKDSDRVDKEGRYMQQALKNLHAIVGKLSSSSRDISGELCLSQEAMDSIKLLIERVERLAPNLPLPDAIETRWACRGIVARTSLPSMELSNLEERAVGLPFDIHAKGVDWNEILRGKEEEEERGKLATSPTTASPSVSVLRDAIPFRFDTIVTRTGSSVTERRGTAWLAHDGIGALAYSGKLMRPQPIPGIVSRVMRAVEGALKMPATYFDCALCNHYPDSEAACKFHTDPEHGTMWERLTCVVAAGDERRFAFRPIPKHSKWSDWEPQEQGKQQQSRVRQDQETIPVAIHLFPGDIVIMWGSCNDDFHHAVYTAETDGGSTENGRVSLVLKRAMDRGGGRRGHGLQGEGRRSKRRQKVNVAGSQAKRKKNNRGGDHSGSKAR